MNQPIDSGPETEPTQAQDSSSGATPEVSPDSQPRTPKGPAFTPNISPEAEANALTEEIAKYMEVGGELPDSLRDEPESSAAPAADQAFEPVAPEKSEADAEPEEVAPDASANADDDEEIKLPKFRLEPSDADELEAFKRVKAREAEIRRGEASPYERLSVKAALAQIEAERTGQRPEVSMEDAGKPDLPAGVPHSVAEVRAAILEARKVRDEAADEVDLDAAAEANAKIDLLIDALPQVEAYEASKSENQRSQAQAAFQAAIGQASDLYPDFADPDSEFSRAVEAREAEAKLTGDPVYHDPKKALILAREVAKEWVNAGKVVRRKGDTPAAPGSPATQPAAPAPAKGAVPAKAGKATAPIAPATAGSSSQASSWQADVDRLAPGDVEGFEKVLERHFGVTKRGF